MQWGAVIVWWLVWMALFVVGLPLAATLFPDADRPTAFAALPLSLVVVLITIEWVGQLVYGPLTAVIGVVVLLGVAGYANRYRGAIDRRAVIEVVGVFTIAFLFLLAIRSVDAGAIPGGGEKFLDFGLVQSLLRAEYLPPADHWWAGGRVIYYYGGHLLTASIALLTGTPGRLAYNLALAGFYAAGVATVYGFGATLAAERGLPRRAAGGIAAFLFAFASNLYTTAGALATTLYPPAIEHLATATGHEPHQVRVTIDTFSYWFASRVIPGTITEFPLFAYLNGDLHAHMTDTALLLLVAVVGFAYYTTPTHRLRRRRLILFGVLPPVIAALTIVNTWSLPAALGLTWLALTFAPATPASVVSGTTTRARETTIEQWLGEGRRTIVAGLLVLPVVALSVVWMAPFVLNVLIAGAANRGIAVLPDRTGLVALFVAHGGFITVFAWYLIGYVPHSTPRRVAVGIAAWVVVAVLSVVFGFVALAVVGPLLVGAWYLHRRGLLDAVDRSGRPGYEALLLVAGAGLLLLVEVVYVRDSASPGRFNTVFKIYAQIWPLFSVAAGTALGAALTRPHRLGAPDWALGRGPRRFAVAALLTALSTYGAFALFEHFNAYATVWIDNLPLVVGILAVFVVLALVIATRVTTSLPTQWTTPTIHPVIVTVLAAVLVFHGAIAVTADDADAPGPDPTIDAIAFVHTWHAGEAPAIEWLLDRPRQPYIVAAPGWNVYGWSSEAASLTGLPTVAGWATEGIYRGGDAYGERASDVDLLFRGPPELRAALLDRYDVTYIYVGPNERQRYSGADLNFSNEPGITYAFNSSAVTIYAVNESQLMTTN